MNGNQGPLDAGLDNIRHEPRCCRHREVAAECYSARTSDFATVSRILVRKLGCFSLEDVIGRGSWESELNGGEVRSD